MIYTLFRHNNLPQAEYYLIRVVSGFNRRTPDEQVRIFERVVREECMSGDKRLSRRR
jgi:hypothetical protein